MCHISHNELFYCTWRSQMGKRKCKFCMIGRIECILNFSHCRSALPCICMCIGVCSPSTLKLWSLNFYRECTEIAYMSCIIGTTGSIHHRRVQFHCSNSHLDCKHSHWWFRLLQFSPICMIRTMFVRQKHMSHRRGGMSNTWLWFHHKSIPYHIRRSKDN